MKVLHVESGKHLYGGAQQVLYIMQGLKDLGVENILACPPSSEIENLAGQFARVKTIHMGGDLDLLMIVRLRKLIINEKIDIVHLHSRRGADVFGGLAAKLAKVPCILSRRVDNREPLWWVKQKYKLYDHVITISEAIKTILLNEQVEEIKLTCVRSAVDASIYDRPCRRKAFDALFGVQEGRIVLAMMAQFIHRKGHRYLLQALPDIITEYPDIQVLLFGKGPLVTDIETLISQLNLGHIVKLAGFRDDLDQWLSCIDILVHPADKEGLGVSLLQASSAGVPVIGSRTGGIPEAVEHLKTGLLIDAGDIHGLADSIKTLLSNPGLRKKMSHRSKQRMRDLFSIEAMAEGNYKVYQEVLAK